MRKGKALPKQRLSHWIMEATVLAYSGKGCPLTHSVRAHSNLDMATSWALFKGVSVRDIFCGQMVITTQFCSFMLDLAGPSVDLCPLCWVNDAC